MKKKAMGRLIKDPKTGYQEEQGFKQCRKDFGLAVAV